MSQRSIKPSSITPISSRSVAKSPSSAKPSCHSQSPMAKSASSHFCSTTSSLSSASSATSNSNHSVDKCHTCKKPIDGESIRFEGCKFHVKHFTCFVCKKDLHPNADSMSNENNNSSNHTTNTTTNSNNNGKFRFHNNKLYCDVHYALNCCPQCKHCKEPVVGNQIQALGGFFHPHHFFCATCQVVIHQTS